MKTVALACSVPNVKSEYDWYVNRLRSSKLCSNRLGHNQSIIIQVNLLCSTYINSIFCLNRSCTGLFSAKCPEWVRENWLICTYRLRRRQLRTNRLGHNVFLQNLYIYICGRRNGIYNEYFSWMQAEMVLHKKSVWAMLMHASSQAHSGLTLLFSGKKIINYIFSHVINGHRCHGWCRYTCLGFNNVCTQVSYYFC
jgi:hypothetical protein